VGELVETTVGQRCTEPGAGPFDCAVPERVQLFGGVIAGRAELPVVVVVPRAGIPRRAERLPLSLVVNV
jgi:hypothetical protein